ncbi:phosphoethanolamine transferase [Lysobacter sp. 5GHs7-4]|uniref:phosphoethanolamine transferase n=1 Tax=Lysobacter sp. 5GHs7-4 TaxID=2904253 RepID=UPI001E5F9100|nr:phosphoethanolamine transferase [Lysobacter sp. 5GHs7-4]UHQ23459.1 phosphoethanolamine transferase [Lysobacter sp. 5GHs7-4]
MAVTATTLRSAPGRSRPSGLRRWAALIALAAACATLTLADDFLQQMTSPHNLSRLELPWALALFGMHLCLWLGGRRWPANLLLAAFALMQLLQLCHIAAMGRPLTPVDLAMIPRETPDIAEAAWAGARTHWPTLLTGALPYAALFALYNLGLPRWPLPRAPLALLVLAFALATKPYKAGQRAMPQYMPAPARSSLHNSINTFSFYAANLLGKPVHSYNLQYQPYRVARTPPPASAVPQNLWLVIFDSTRSDHWGVAGYARDTTPTLSRWVAQGQARWHHGIAGATATSASLALLINGVREPGNLAQQRSYRTNLMRLAKAAGYRTHWLSTQSPNLLNELDVASIDVVRTRDSDLKRVIAVRDDAILDMARRVAPDTRNFVVIMVRTAHLPYEKNYAHHGQRYARWPTAPTLPFHTRQRNAYDNAILYQDALIAQLYQRFEALPGKGLFVVTSDHGQMLGENGVWGHNVLTPQVAQVPVLVRARGLRDHLPPGNGGWISHYGLGRALMAQLGYRIDNPNIESGVDYLQGSNLYTDNPFREVGVRDGRLRLGEMYSLSELDADLSRYALRPSGQAPNVRASE